MKIKCLHNGKIYEVVEETEKYYIVDGPVLSIPVMLMKTSCVLVDDNSELTNILESEV